MSNSIRSLPGFVHVPSELLRSDAKAANDAILRLFAMTNDCYVDGVRDEARRHLSDLRHLLSLRDP